DNVSIGNTAPETAVDDKFRTGWVLGAGAEYAINDRVSGKLEYLHMDFGKYSGFSANNEFFYFKDHVDIIRIGVNYRF
ncbi:MAG TPA: porin family protein, partial [Rhizobiales bacterium]|nr:porin family protein [Hyphomicrobiales bacterium]